MALSRVVIFLEAQMYRFNFFLLFAGLLKTVLLKTNILIKNRNKPVLYCH